MATNRPPIHELLATLSLTIDNSLNDVDQEIMAIRTSMSDENTEIRNEIMISKKMIGTKDETAPWSNKHGRKRPF
jgi:hypothetical protein